VHPAPVGGPHVEADEVDRRAGVILGGVETRVDRRGGLAFAACGHELVRRHRLDELRRPVDPVAVGADVVHAARLVAELPDHHRVVLELRHHEAEIGVVALDGLGVLVEAAREVLVAVPVAARRRRRVRDGALACPRQVLRESPRPLPKVVHREDGEEAAALQLVGEADDAGHARRVVLAERRLDGGDDPERLAVRPLGRPHDPQHVDAHGLEAVEVALHLIPATADPFASQRRAGPVVEAAHEERLAAADEARPADLEAPGEAGRGRRHVGDGDRRARRPDDGRAGRGVVRAGIEHEAAGDGGRALQDVASAGVLGGHVDLRGLCRTRPAPVQDRCARPALRGRLPA